MNLETVASRSDAEMRFAFGANWAAYVERHFSEERVEISRRHLLDFLKLDDLRGRTFLDIGCGSGLHSMAAFRAGASRIISFDYDVQSVATARQLRSRCGSPEYWTVLQGSVLDDEFIATLPKSDIVYSWGVLHHTGDMWKAVLNAARCLHGNSMFYIALYSSDAYTSPTAEYWLRVKREYNEAGALKRHWMEWQYAWNHSIREDLQARRNPLKRIREYKASRGMSYWHDVRDWLGGYPMDFAGNKETEEFCRARLGLELIHLKAGEANTEYLFRPAGAANYWDNVAARRAIARCDGPFKRVQGFAWSAMLPITPEQPGKLMLYEDGSPVGWPNQSEDMIVAWGRGRYRVERNRLVFSSTDGSDPNKHRYEYRLDFA